MSEKTSISNVQNLESATKVQWRRDPGYFLVGTLLIFLFQAAVIAISSPNIPPKPHLAILTIWAAWLSLRIFRKRRERRLLEAATITIEPTRPNLGSNLAVSITLIPTKRLMLSAWSVTLMCTQVSAGDDYAEEEPMWISKVERAQYVGTTLTPHAAFQSSNILNLPTDAPATGLAIDYKVSWYLYIDIEFGGSPVWGLKDPIRLTVLP